MAPREEDAATASLIEERFRGLIATGALGAGERLPAVRQTAADFGVAPGTAARAYRALEADGLIATRRGAGTRVAERASPLPRAVVAELRALVDLAKAARVDVHDLHGALRAVWEGDAGPVR